MRRGHLIRPNPFVQGGSLEQPGSARAPAFRGFGRHVDDPERFWEGHRGAVETLQGAGVNVGEPLGCGHFGCVYELADYPFNWVIKITGDPTEAAAWATLLNRGIDAPGLPNVAMVFAFPEAEDQLYGVVIERLYPLEGYGRPHRRPHPASEQTAASIFVHDPQYARELRILRNKVELALLQMEDPTRQKHLERAREFAPTFEALWRGGVMPEDLDTHGNVMKSARGEWKIADLGVARAPEAYVVEFELLDPVPDIAEAIEEALGRRRLHRPARIANLRTLRRRLTRQ